MHTSKNFDISRVVHKNPILHSNWQAGNSTMITHISNFTGAVNGFAGDFDENVEQELNELSIFNEMGQLVLQKNRDLWEELDISHLPKGMYIVLTRHGTSVSRRKIIKF